MNIRELPKEFTKFGDTFRQEGYNPATEMYLYSRTLEADPSVIYYEVFKRKIGNEYKQPDKKCVRYPGNEDFGKWAKCCRDREKAKQYYDNGV
ncbi:hypothetical protein M2480_002046 [Parabacteroides sp. PFB2-12]|uniref:hypothetical protein n=1 Tax=unclassified Parabacteroides TaxID=2649774 RepID=UPI0024768119|nr:MULTISPECIES: hypothetical protein [unclassified Parabacteroides]MDH6342928.1 hypothetical protein [Parabacteroides sp. PM6-13]MDH6391057.1 hypothetical protein [Parabacteroides sp. PFB2-12]